RGTPARRVVEGRSWRGEVAPPAGSAVPAEHYEGGMFPLLLSGAPAERIAVGRLIGAHMLRDAGSGVQRDCLPDGLYMIFSDVVGLEKLSGGICAIDLEAFVWARELLDQAEIVKSSGHVEEFSVETQFPLTTLLCREQVDTHRVIEQQIGGMLV